MARKKNEQQRSPDGCAALSRECSACKMPDQNGTAKVQREYDDVVTERSVSPQSVAESPEERWDWTIECEGFVREPVPCIRLLAPHSVSGEVVRQELEIPQAREPRRSRDKYQTNLGSLRQFQSFSTSHAKTTRRISFQRTALRGSMAVAEWLRLRKDTENCFKYASTQAKRRVPKRGRRLCPFCAGSGGGIRTPDTRIMIPLL